MKRTADTRRSLTDARPIRIGVGLAAASLVALVLSSGSEPLQEDDVDVDGARAVLEQYVQVRTMISSERREWALEQDYIESRIELLELEVASLQQELATTESSINDTDRERAELNGRNDELKETSKGVESIIAELESGTRSLLPRIPPPLADQVRLVSQQLPADGEESDLSLGIRFQNVIAVLNELNKFDRSIHLSNESIDSDGVPITATTLHIGLGRAYYMTPEKAGVGPMPMDADDPEATWQWQSYDSAREQIELAVQIMQDEKPPAFVELPVLDVIPVVGQ
ncbi:MAG: DUF3450 family protein [Planctomycetota bacterium]|jgi:hypothetical protein